MSTNTIAKEAVSERSLLQEKATGPVRTKKKTDQTIPSVNKATISEETEKRNLPLFIETLFKAREFDPL